MKTKYLAFAAAAFILASCSNDEDFAPQDNLKYKPITVTAGVAELTTRAGYEGTSTLPENFYLDIDQGNTTYNYTKVEMTKKGNGTTYTPKDGSNLLWASNDHKVNGIYAYTTNVESFSVQTDQSAADGSGVLASDLLGAKYNKSIEVNGDNITIRFFHLLCKLDVTLKWGTEWNNKAISDKAIKSVKYINFGKDVTLNRTDCTITPGTNTAEITAYTTTTTDSNGETYLSEAIFAPCQGLNTKIVIVADIMKGTGGLVATEEHAFSIDVTEPSGGFVSGKCYTMNVTIGGTAVDGGSVTATVANGWETGDANGDAAGTNGNMATN